MLPKTPFFNRQLLDCGMSPSLPVAVHLHWSRHRLRDKTTVLGVESQEFLFDTWEIAGVPYV